MVDIHTKEYTQSVESGIWIELLVLQGKAESVYCSKSPKFETWRPNEFYEMSEVTEATNENHPDLPVPTCNDTLRRLSVDGAISGNHCFTIPR